MQGAVVAHSCGVCFQAKPYLEQGEVEAVLDPRMVGEVDPRSLRRVAAAVLMCLRKEPGNRPTMPEVAQFLAEEDLDHSQV